MSGKGDHRSEPCVDAGCRYDEIRDLCIEQLAFTWLEDSTTEATRESVDEKIDLFATGKLEYAKEVVFALLEIAAEGNDVTSPADASHAVSLSRFRLLGLMLNACFVQLGHSDASHEPCSLGVREGGAHQIYSRGGVFRQEVLG